MVKEMRIGLGKQLLIKHLMVCYYIPLGYVSTCFGLLEDLCPDLPVVSIENRNKYVELEDGVDGIIYDQDVLTGEERLFVRGVFSDKYPGGMTRTAFNALDILVCDEWIKPEVVYGIKW